MHKSQSKREKEIGELIYPYLLTFGVYPAPLMRMADLANKPVQEFCSEDLVIFFLFFSVFSRSY